MESFDSVTRLIRKSINILFLNYKIRTSLGVLVGICIFTLQQILKPFLEKFQRFDFLEIKLWQFIIIGLFILHIPTLKQAFSNKPIFDENIDKLFASARLACEEGELSLVQRRMIYMALCKQVLDNVQLNEATDKEKKQLEESIKN